MKPRIIVAGAGHGGLAAAARLAKDGYSVLVIEKRARGELGYEWSDSFDRDVLVECGIPPIPERRFQKANTITYTNPKKTVFITEPEGDKKKNVLVDRKYLIGHLIRYAKKCGVTFSFGEEVLSPIVDKNRVIGVTTRKSSRLYARKADLIIDAAGIDSPVRSTLPASFGIVQHFSKDDVFSCYRGFFEKTDGSCPEIEQTVYICHMGKSSMTWLIDEYDRYDILIGLIGRDITFTEVDAALSDLRADFGSIGEKEVSQPAFCRIPIRRAVSTLCADGYALIGDSAAMTMPLTGSGLNNSFLASRLLCDAVENDEQNRFSRETLWSYQYNYFVSAGNKMNKLEKIKDLLTGLSVDDVDFLMEKGIVSQSELGIDPNSQIEPTAVFQKILKMLLKPGLVTQTNRAVSQFRSARICADILPEQYDEAAVEKWKKIYDSL